MGGSLLHGLPLVGLPNIYIYIYMYVCIYIKRWALGLGAVGFEIITYNLFYLFFIFFESMHLSERLQTFRNVAFWFINTTQDSDRKYFCFWFFLHFNNWYIHTKERKTVKEFA